MKPPNTEPKIPEGIGKEDRLRIVEATCRLFAGQGRSEKDAELLTRVATEFEKYVRDGAKPKP